MQATIYHENLVEIVSKALNVYQAKIHWSQMFFSFHFLNINICKYFLIQKLASFLSFGKNNSHPWISSGTEMSLTVFV